MLDTISDLPH